MKRILVHDVFQFDLMFSIYFTFSWGYSGYKFGKNRRFEENVKENRGNVEEERFILYKQINNIIKKSENDRYIYNFKLV